jgi:hypothetical protein
VDVHDLIFEILLIGVKLVGWIFWSGWLGKERFTLYFYTNGRSQVQVSQANKLGPLSLAVANDDMDQAHFVVIFRILELRW